MFPEPSFIDSFKFKPFGLTNRSTKVYNGSVKEGFVVGNFIGFYKYQNHNYNGDILCFEANEETIKLYRLEAGENSLEQALLSNDFVLFKALPLETIVVGLDKEVVAPIIDRETITDLINKLDL